MEIDNASYEECKNNSRNPNKLEKYFVRQNLSQNHFCKTWLQILGRKNLRYTVKQIKNV